MIEEIAKFSPKQLEVFKMNLESYRQGVIDTWRIFEEVFDKTVALYTDKIEQCEREINKHAS